MKLITIFAIAIVMLSILGCKSTKQTSEEPSVQALPKAVIYKTNGNYNNNVTVTLSADGKSLVSYPASSDVSDASAALPLGNGWLFDRRGGIGKSTAFLKYTYAEYSKMKRTPSQQQILAAVIPGAKVTEVKELPILQSQAMKDHNLLMQYTN